MAKKKLHSKIKPIDKSKVKALKLEKHEDMKIKLDKSGFFLIKVNKSSRMITVGFCNYKNELLYSIRGKEPKDIIKTILKHKLISQLDHAAYLGRELEKAKLSSKLNIEYVQDEELKK